MSINKAIIVGNVGEVPKLNHTGSGKSVANFSVATNESWVNKAGEKQERTEWHNIVCWEKLADICAQYVTKGKQVYVEGRLQHREYEAKDGIKKTVTEILATKIELLGSRNGQ